MASTAQRFMGGGNAGKVAIKKPVTRGGKTFQQTFWVSPAEAVALQMKGKKKKTVTIDRGAKARKIPAPKGPAVKEMLAFIEHDYTIDKEHYGPLWEKLDRLWSNDAYNADDAKAWFKRVGKQAVREYAKKNGADKAAKMTDEVVDKVATGLEERFLDDMKKMEEYEARKREKKAAKQAKPKKKQGKTVMTDERQGYLDANADEMGLDSEDISAAYAAPEGYEFHVRRMSAHKRNDVHVLDIDGKIYSEDGKLQGEMKRTLVRKADGDILAQHQLLWLEDHAQDSGIGTEMVLNQFESYEEMGVSEVSLSADRVGKYLWMKLGFVPHESDQRDIRSSGKYFLEEMVEQGQIDKDQHEVIADLLKGNLNDFARLKGLPVVRYGDLLAGDTVEEWPINKALLLRGRSWSGRMEVGGPDWDTTMEILNGYVAGNDAKASESKYATQ